MSTNFSFFPPSFAQGFRLWQASVGQVGLAKQVYAESPELRRGADRGDAPSSGSGARCAVARMAANAAQKSANFIGKTSYKMFWRVISGAVLGKKVGSGDPPPPIDEYEKELQDRYRRIAILTLLASLLRSSDPCSKEANYFDQLKESLYESTLGFYKSSLENVYAFDTVVNNNPSLSDAIKRSFGYFGQVGKCQTVGACVMDLWGATKKSATDLSAGAGLSALIPSTKPKKILPGNPNYKPYLEIIKKAVSEYSAKNPGKKIVTRKTPKDGQIDEQFIITLMNKPFDEAECAHIECSSKIGKTPLEVLLNNPVDTFLLDNPKVKFNTVMSILFDNIIKKDRSFADLLMVTGSAWDVSDKEAAYKIGLFVENTYKRTGVPVNNTLILEYAIELSDGEIYKALDNVTSFYKLYRGYSKENSPLVLKNKVLDEFSQDISWDKLKDDDPPRTHSGLIVDNDRYGFDYDLSWLNRIGEAYHTTNLISLSRDFSPSIVPFMALKEYILFGGKHGLGKQITDVAVLKDLYEIDSYLSQFNPDSPRPWPPACR